MKSLLKMSWMEAKLFLREPASAFFTLVFPLIYLFLYGAISGNEPTPMYGGQRTIEVAIPSLTAVIIAMAGLMSNTMTMATYREKGILRRLRTTPVSPLVVLVAQVIVTFVMTLLGMVLLVVAGRLVFGVRFTGNVFSLLAGFTLGSLSFFSIGFILAGIMPTVRTAWVAAMVIVYPMLLLSGAFFAVEVLPPFVQKISSFIPLTYIVNLLRGLWSGEPWSSHLRDVAVLVGMLVLGVGLAAKTFRWE
ncbi:MAG: Inner membrane transport permease YbhR [Chloroflexi bacterium ADurb.Bin360]|nr:MAG: Inner membrane transport permease YbhR [Chloroflexi bacterium ADurb.Bin360]